MRKRVVVLYADGAASPTEVLNALPVGAQPTFAVQALDPRIHALQRLLQGRAEVVPFEGDRDLGQALAQRQPAVMVTFSEQMLELASRAGHEQGQPIHGLDTVTALRDKGVQRTRLAAAGLAVPDNRLLTRAELDDLRLLARPHVLKPAVGMASRHTYRVGAGLPVPEAMSLPDVPFILEEELLGVQPAHPVSGDYLSVEALSVDGVHHPVAVVGRFPVVPQFRERGCIFPSGWPPTLEAQSRKLAMHALDALGVRDGISHTEIKITPEGPRVIEVNGRLGGNIANLLRRAVGVDLLREWFCRLGCHDEPSTERMLPVADPGTSTTYRWFMQPAEAKAGRLLGVDGLEHARRLDGVDAVKVLKRQGDVVDWRDGTSSAVLQVDGRVGDLNRLGALVAELDDVLDVTLAAKADRPCD